MKIVVTSENVRVEVIDDKFNIEYHITDVKTMLTSISTLIKEINESKKTKDINEAS